MSKDAPLIHVGFQYNEAIQAKRDLLSLEMNLLEATKSVTNYHAFRIEELKLKLKLHIRTKEYISLLKQLKRLLPKYKLPKILQESDIEHDVERLKKEEEMKVFHYGSDVDSQLEKIQDKLKALQ